MSYLTDNDDSKYLSASSSHLCSPARHTRLPPDYVMGRVGVLSVAKNILSPRHVLPLPSLLVDTIIILLVGFPEHSLIYLFVYLPIRE